MRVYLDTCCYNRPYDNDVQLMVRLEAQCKLHIQNMVKDGLLTLVSSYMLLYECEHIPYEIRRSNISSYITQYAKIYVGTEVLPDIELMASNIMKTGVKFKDACHVASAIYAGCKYFISTDKRLLKYKSSEIELVTPIDFVSRLEGNDYVG